MYVSLLGISGALYLSVFEQLASKVFFGPQLVVLGLVSRDSQRTCAAYAVQKLLDYPAKLTNR
jgi:hypothetical protein